jgi:hypothetical protein
MAIREYVIGLNNIMRHAVAVEMLCYGPEVRGFEPRCGQLIFKYMYLTQTH